MAYSNVFFVETEHVDAVKVVNSIANRKIYSERLRKDQLLNASRYMVSDDDYSFMAFRLSLLLSNPESLQTYVTGNDVMIWLLDPTQELSTCESEIMIKTKLLIDSKAKKNGFKYSFAVMFVVDRDLPKPFIDEQTAKLRNTVGFPLLKDVKVIVFNPNSRMFFLTNELFSMFVKIPKLPDFVSESFSDENIKFNLEWFQEDILSGDSVVLEPSSVPVNYVKQFLEKYFTIDDYKDSRMCKWKKSAWYDFECDGKEECELHRRHTYCGADYDHERMQLLDFTGCKDLLAKITDTDDLEDVVMILLTNSLFPYFRSDKRYIYNVSKPMYYDNVKLSLLCKAIGHEERFDRLFLDDEYLRENVTPSTYYRAVTLLGPNNVFCRRMYLSLLQKNPRPSLTILDEHIDMSPPKYGKFNPKYHNDILKIDEELLANKGKACSKKFLAKVQKNRTEIEEEEEPYDIFILVNLFLDGDLPSLFMRLYQ